MIVTSRNHAIENFKCAARVDGPGVGLAKLEDAEHRVLENNRLRHKREWRARNRGYLVNRQTE